MGQIKLTPSASIKGVVHNKLGIPVSNIWVRYVDHNQNLKSRFRYIDGEPETENGFQTVNETYTQRVCRTDQLGRFTFTNLVAGPGFLEVIEAQHYLENGYSKVILHTHAVELKEGQELTGVKVLTPQ